MATATRIETASIVRNVFDYWPEAAVREALEELIEYKKGVKWKKYVMDGSITKTPFRGQGIGPNPTDRTQPGTKRSILVEVNGMPLVVAVPETNRNDMKITGPTLPPENIFV